MNNNRQEKLAVNLAEAAKMAGVSVQTMRQMANRKGFPAFRCGARWIIPIEPFKEWLAAEACKGA